MKKKMFYLALIALSLRPMLGLSAPAEKVEMAEADMRAARPGVYWYFMDGNQDRNEMVADLEAMAEVGIGSVLFLEVNIGVPVGPVPFMSEQWQDNLVHAIKTCERLEMEFILGTGPGWSGSGGPWVKPEDSMQHLVGSSTPVQGPSLFEGALAVPQPHTPGRHAGMGYWHGVARNKWYQDVAVLAVPAPKEGLAAFEQYELKTLKDVLPYSPDRTVPRFVEPSADFDEPDSGAAIDSSKIIDLTDLMEPDGTLRWEVPEGDWTIMRFVARSTGQTTRPAPKPGHGFECDKFNADAYRRHWDNFQGKLLEKLGPLKKGKGLTTIHLDSWEMSSQNWTAAFRSEFLKRRGYDPQPWYPAYMGHIVDSPEKTERFLWDMRKTSQELLLENHAGIIKKIAHEHGLQYSNEPYDMNPAGDLDLGSVADIPMGEFWNSNTGAHTEYSCIEAVSIAHTMGKAQVNAEAFTSAAKQFQNDPENMKDQTDWALAMGINGFMFHTFQHQSTGDTEKPGCGMGIYGVQWHRNQTWWPLLSDYHEYIARCSAILRQGQAVADILYLTPEGAPHIFLAPDSALTKYTGPVLRNKKGYNFDAVSPRILKMRAKVEDGKIAFPGGTSYSLLVLPDVETMTPEMLDVISELVNAGATVMGNPPRKSPSLVGYPDCDEVVRQRAEALWAEGKILRYAPLESRADGLFPEYSVTATALADMGIVEDFQSDGPIRYGHRRTDNEEIYFVSNTTAEKQVTTCRFRVTEAVPELVDPMSGERRSLPDFTQEGSHILIPLTFEARESFFVVFRAAPAEGALVSEEGEQNFPSYQKLEELEGAWEVAFDPEWGGPEAIQFEALQDWRLHSERGIQYYSGSATYRKSFDAPESALSGQSFLSLGVVHDICRVRLNGKDLGVLWTSPWRVETTGLLKSKDNELEIEVVNGWVNRLIGDQQPEDANVRSVSWPSGLLDGKSYETGRYTFFTASPYKADAPLMPSGLLGPVRLMGLANTGSDTM